ncbi:ATP-binding protein [Streptomyces reticuli]|uniref:ATP-binding protein n=1 Tax=Streptomyces reticuli TaxID=1926 RepID=UPI00073E0CFF|nr:hypothetical protein [Streptomyces sp. SID7810]CUW30099.1 hypothetical protein TUE45_04818 [Streptomyces reticuli]
MAERTEAAASRIASRAVLARSAPEGDSSHPGTAELDALIDSGAFHRLGKESPASVGPIAAEYECLELTNAPVSWTQRFSSTERGARLARHLLVLELDGWGFPYKGTVSDRVALVAAELVSNAVRHGRVPGRDFELRVTELEHTFRVEVSDSRGEKKPSVRAAGDEEGGFGMCLVGALTTDWGVSERSPGKVVWAEIPKSGDHA